ncbi:DUF438 domain-containing protein [Tepidimicrobium xylanilyticum]|uniref:PAC domain-containing protein n=1 Tax=Tepidimicrobium xylanilyticum TaxID=1123352 RepID=A0A1H2X6M1_9FIRM|nr:DUF438 domain-containing protein [Tepidimicrobium xylanilyticum]GMG97416.1 hypothetical protein EN5CB1_22420 [Tepidimicrobium xylanilyticum]SDW88540.1 hypothetical protein SAMN05660923_01359 [Tepidimicrobium xylanilyticum]
MSELINNREYRQKLMKEVIRELHAGKTVDEVKEKFSKVIEGVPPSEIAAMEAQLVKEGLPIEEIQRLCNVHAEVFKGSIEEIHHPEEVPGHPIYIMREENRAIEEYIDNTLRKNIEKFRMDDSNDNINDLISDLNLLWDVDKHYSRKENLIFPYLEKYGITTPPQVMWGVDDEIRALIKEAKLMLMDYRGNKEEVIQKIEEMAHEIKEMIYKEEKILFPMALETLTEDEWVTVYRESDEIGYAIIEPEKDWELKRVRISLTEGGEISEKGNIKFETGFLTPEEISQILNTIPGDITFVDKNDIVKYYSQGKERIFARTKSVIGRSVQNCHPPASVHVVEKIVKDFKSGKKDHEDFWIKMGDKYVMIRYFAVRNKDGEYLGTLEFTQNIAPIKAIEGEKRLLSED